jgi:hypothetical protein
MDTGFFAYLRAFGSRWGTALSGIACVPFSIAALYVSGSMQRVGYGLTAGACFVYSSFDLWRTERRRFLREATSRNGKDEWKKLEEQFSKFILPENSFRHLTAMWIAHESQGLPITWAVTGGVDEIQRESFEALMEEAGNLLTTSEYVKGKYPRHLTSSNPFYRWMNTLCASRDEEMDSSGTMSVDGRIESESGTISDLARKCKVICAQLAAKEGWRLPQERT